MGNNNLKETNNILVKVDQNNLIYIDPNTVLSDGKAVPRSVEPENLVMYVNLEADLIPRTTLIGNGDENSLTSIAGGTLNFLQNKDGRDYDTKWTDAYTNIPSTTYNFKDTGVYNAPNDASPDGTPSQGGGQYDNTAQSFGIDSVSIDIAGANFIPKVTINFIDVRGKTLFESPENSPYGAFFHLPWPIFYLTVKGYYGKAIKYRLHLVRFNTRFNASNGNLEVQTDFVGSTYAYMSDISLKSILNAPYFYSSEFQSDGVYNEETKRTEVRISKSTKGYRVLKSVYQEYKSKGLLPKDFPVKTLREIIMISRNLNELLEKEVFSAVVDPKILSGVKDFEDRMKKFEDGISGWKKINLSPEYFVNGTKRSDTGEEIRWYKLSSKEKNTLDRVVGRDKEGSLEYLINNAVRLLEANPTFGKDRDKKLIKDDKLIISPISFTMLKNIKDFYVQETTVGIDMDGLHDAVYTVYRNFIEQRVKLESDIEQRMNEIIKNKDLGIGFEPTIRNIFGVVLANADTYVRLMKDVHTTAFASAQIRKKILSGVKTDSDKASECIYPWPEIKSQSAGGRELVLMYPGSREMIGKLQSNNKILWPEVEFVENFYEIGTKKSNASVEDSSFEVLEKLGRSDDTSSSIDYIFDTQGSTEKKDISVLTNFGGIIPYGDKSFSSVLYEIYERAKYTTSISPFSNDVIRELADAEFDNIQAQLSEDIDVVDMLKENIKTRDNLLSFMQSLSLYERYPYYVDQLPTIWYLKDALSQDFMVTKYLKPTRTDDYNSYYEDLRKFIKEDEPQPYRANIYPFNSTTYEGYLGDTFSVQDLKVNGLLTLKTPSDFIISPESPIMWVKDGFTENFFTHTIDIDGTSKQILNTPYFHKQLYTDFTKSQAREKYTGSAYLLLNSLPFKDLDDEIVYVDEDNKPSPATLMSSLFRETGATHFVPYHMMLKWGSIYHRYKKWITDSVDIINGVTVPIDGSVFYTVDSGMTYNNTPESIGFHPYYETVFHQIVNGYAFFNPLSGATNTYEGAISSGITYLYSGTTDGENTYTSFIDNTRFGYSGYTLLPTNGYNSTYGTDFTKSEQENFRIIWGIGTSDTKEIDYSGYTLPTSYEYFKTTDSTDNYSLSTNYRKVVDLIATFKPDILDVFEQAFLDFSSEKLNEEISYSPYDVTYSKFQDLLKKISSVSKPNSDIGLYSTDKTKFIREIKDRQIRELVILTSRLLSPENLVKITLSNPREIDNYVLGGFTGINVQNFSTDLYPGSLTTQMEDDIRLYLGENLDGNEYYKDFFDVMDIYPSEDNIKQFRQIIYIYAGLRATGLSYGDLTKETLVTHLRNEIISPSIPTTGPKATDASRRIGGMDVRLNNYLDHLIERIQKDLVTSSVADRATKTRGYNDDPVKLELYNYFKSFNDKWTAGNSIGQRTLLEEFLFLDKANKDIGNSLFIDMQRLSNLNDDKNSNINLFSLIVLLTKGSGIDIRALPAYVNFYGTNFTNTAKRIPSKNLAQSMFGAYLDVDHQDASPKIILQYTGPTSKHPELEDINKKYKYKNDGFDIGNVNNNPIIVAPDVFTKTDFSKSNKVVAFEVSFGDQNQSIFKGIELDQATLKNTSESFEVIERLGRNETGSSTSQIDIGLFNIYRQASYQCTVTAMGNLMIQPTMYFYIKNVPLFRGSYLITEVKHNIKTTGIETVFKGTRIPSESLPNPSDSFLASYRPLFDRLIGRARAIVNEETRVLSESSGTEKTVVYGTESYTFDPGTVKVSGEKILDEVGMTNYGIPYNGKYSEKYIQMVKYRINVDSEYREVRDKGWLRAVAVLMGGPNYPIDDKTVMNIISNLTFGETGVPRNITWGDIKHLSASQSFYSSKFLLNGSTPLKYVTPDIIHHDFRVTELLNPRLEDKQYKSIITIPNKTNFISNIYEGPINVGPAINGYGIGVSEQLRQRLTIKDGQVVYFRMS